MRLGGAKKRALIMLYDAAAMILSLWLAFSLRYGEFYVPDLNVMILFAGAVVLGSAALFMLRVYRMVVRYLHVRTASRLVIGAAGAASVWFVLAYISKVPGLPRSVGFIYFGLLFFFMFFGRLQAAQIVGDVEPRFRVHGKETEAKRPKRIGVVIEGANATGLSLAESLNRDPQYKLRFFVDANPAMVGRNLFGYPIKSFEELGQEVARGRVAQVFLAMPTASRSERLAALSRLSTLPVKVLTVPSYAEIKAGHLTVSDVRPIKVEDLLKRDIVPPLKRLIEDGIADRTVLVTGAGGSIGSELCRQILSHNPRQLIMLDHSEFALYSIERELQQARFLGRATASPKLTPVIGTILDPTLVQQVLGRFEVDSVFHAAAYKHVPLLEANEIVGVRNNVFGTKVLADACLARGVARFTMISTDKAVRPTNVMGASKRLSELYIQALAQQPNCGTKFGIVRFGNVLDSSGSVVQQFRHQIASGGPITVTDERITRFFMSIPEATQLVLQANSLAAGGEVFVLDMGDPVKIVDLARTMIALSGMRERDAGHPDGDIEINFIGLRPGEKLHEELFVGDSIGETAHPQIKMARERSIQMGELSGALGRLERALESHDATAVRAMLRSLLEDEHQLAA